MKLSIPNSLKAVFDFLREILVKAVYLEFKTDAGKINFFGFISTIVIALILLLRDVWNFVFLIASTLLKRDLPDVNSTALSLFILAIPIELIWCIWVVSRIEYERSKKEMTIR